MTIQDIYKYIYNTFVIIYRYLQYVILDFERFESSQVLKVIKFYKVLKILKF